MAGKTDNKIKMFPIRKGDDHSFTDKELAHRVRALVEAGELECLVVIGWKADGTQYVSASDDCGTLVEVNWMLDKAKEYILSYGEDE